MSHFADDETLTHIAALEAEVMRLREIIEKLWAVIDDIDTYSDMAKADDKLYRSLVERRQKDRWGTRINCDGHKLEFPTQFTPTALNELIEKVEKMTIERCAGVCKTLDRKEKRHAAGYGPGYLTYTASDCEQIIRAIPNVTLEDLK